MARDREFTPEEREEIRRRSLERRARREREAAGTTREGREPQARTASRGDGSRRVSRADRVRAGETAVQTQRRAANPQRRASDQRAQRPESPSRAREAREMSPRQAPQTPQKGGSSKAPLIIVALIVIALVAFGVYKFVLKPAAPTAGGYSVEGTAENAPIANPFTPANPVAKENSPEAEEAITLTLNGDRNTIVLKGEQYIEPGYHAVERAAHDISASVKVEGKVDTNKVGDYQVKYTVSTSDGLTLSRTRTVHVVDSMDKDTDGIPVLMYHYVYSDAKGYHPEGAEENTNFVLDTDLAAQLDYLVSNGYYFPSYAELRAYVDGTHSLPAKSVVLTFDDGSPDFLTYGIPVLEQYQVVATSFLVGVDNIAPCLLVPSEFVTYQSHSYDMHRPGGDYGHGGRIGAMSEDEIVADLQQNALLLDSHDAFAYPYGDAPEWGISAVHKAGVLCAFTTEYGLAHVGDDPANLMRIRVLGTADLASFIASL